MGENTVPGNPLGEERRDIRYIRDVLWPEFLEQFIRDNREYPADRPLGARAEWHGMHRKVGKLKAPIWEGQEWTGREPVRRMFQEIIGHAFLAIASLDYDGANCSSECAESHTYGTGCSVGRMLRKPKMVHDMLPPALAEVARVWPSVPLTEALKRGSVVPAPADETEAYTAQRERRWQRAESRSEADGREAAAWRVRHCGPACAYGHTFKGECANIE